VASVQPSDSGPAVAQLARQLDVPILRGSGNAMRALSAVAGWMPALPAAPPRSKPIDLHGLLRPGALSEYDSGSVLERYGIAVGARRRAHSPDEAARAAAELGFPVVVKREGPAHKSRDGGVIMGLDDEASVKRAAQRLGGAVLVAAQLAGKLEVFCGMTRDPDYGPVLAVGLGGTAVERLPGARSCIAPLAIEGARRLVEETAVVSKLVSPAALDAIAGVLVALGRLAVEHPEVVAADVNPLVVDGSSAVAVDALVIVGAEGM
jgi:acetyltransferase